MGWISEIVNAPVQMLCAVQGHDYTRLGKRLICVNCGHEGGRNG